MPEKPTYEELLVMFRDYQEVVQELDRLRKVEQALLESERKYRHLVESLERDYIIYRHDQDGNFTYLSPSIVNVLGYSQEEFLGHYTDYLTDNPINRGVKERTDAALRGEKQEP